MLPVYGLVILDGAAGAVLLRDPSATFPTMINLRSIIGDKSIIAILSLAVMLPMVTGKIDLTVGYGIVLWHILAISLQTKYGFPWPLAVLSVLVLGAFVGFLNGVLVEVAQIDAFIATLGTGTILYAIAMWHCQGHQVVGVAPDGFYALAGLFLFDLPITGYYVLALSLALWIVLEYLPIGRYFYTIGANPKAAALNGIPVRRYTIIAFVTSGLLTAFAGVLLASRLRIGQASVGLEYLLPALVGAFLGSTTIKPGRVNVWGTIVGVIDPRDRHFRHPAVRRARSSSNRFSMARRCSSPSALPDTRSEGAAPVQRARQRHRRKPKGPRTPPKSKSKGD